MWDIIYVKIKFVCNSTWNEQKKTSKILYFDVFTLKFMLLVKKKRGLETEKFIILPTILILECRISGITKYFFVVGR